MIRKILSVSVLSLVLAFSASASTVTYRLSTPGVV